MDDKTKEDIKTLIEAYAHCCANAARAQELYAMRKDRLITKAMREAESQKAGIKKYLYDLLDK